MPLIRRISLAFCLLGCFVTLPASSQVSRPRARPSPAAAAALETQRRATVEGERVSRSARPSAPAPVAGPGGLITFPNNGIVQVPVTGTTPIGLSKQVGPLAPGTPPCPYVPGMRTASLVRSFAEVSWHVCVTDMGMKSLWVGPVHLQRTPSAPWTTVLHQAGLADIFVPYHDGVPTHRYFDLRFTSGLLQVAPQDAGLNGSLIQLTNETIPTVVAEVRERGVAWLCKGTFSSATRRGQEMVVWGVAEGGNYDNIIEYSFRDDGGMTFRMGNTGYNSPGMPTQPHTHAGLWRVDIDLHGPLGDVGWWARHREPVSSSLPLHAADSLIPVSLEGMRQWNNDFDSLLVTDQATTPFGSRNGYQLTPLQHGTSRHFGPGEAWAEQDIFLTRYHPWELGWATTWTDPQNYLMSYFNSEPLANQDLVIWVRTAAHHHPTDEDRATADAGTTDMTGITLTHWNGFRLDPYDLFQANPMGGPSRCGP